MKRTWKLFDAAAAVFLALIVYRIAGSAVALAPIAAAALSWSLVRDLLDLREARRRRSGSHR